VQIQAREGEGFESVLKRFTRGVQASGILREYRVSQRFRSKADRAREKRRRAARSRRKRA
jgi:small subunit ribosomal protein S21